jgi:hypothetical protein
MRPSSATGSGLCARRDPARTSASALDRRWDARLNSEPLVPSSPSAGLLDKPGWSPSDRSLRSKAASDPSSAPNGDAIVRGFHLEPQDQLGHSRRVETLSCHGTRQGIGGIN